MCWLSGQLEDDKSQAGSVGEPPRQDIHGYSADSHQHTFHNWVTPACNEARKRECEGQIRRAHYRTQILSRRHDVRRTRGHRTAHACQQGSNSKFR
ncbi:hypothetical protein LIA77_02125 [Sarocladium implicatum]|nr:hypothetical protein LIA77_02125 [Sarocladium implicatum]